MPVVHCYLDASDNIAQYKADECFRQAITVAEYFADDRLADLDLYRFDEEGHENGMECWFSISLDKYTRPENPEKPFQMMNSSGTREWAVSGNTEVFVSKKELRKLGIQIPNRDIPTRRRTKKTTMPVPPATLRIEYLPKFYLGALRTYVKNRLDGLREKLTNFHKETATPEGISNAFENIDDVFEASARHGLFAILHKMLTASDAEQRDWSKVAENIREQAAYLARSSTRHSSVTAQLKADSRRYVFNIECDRSGVVPLIEELASAQKNGVMPVYVEVAYGRKMIDEGKAKKVA